MSQPVKDIVSTMQGTDRREAVKAMTDLLTSLRQLPEWTDDKIEFVLGDGRTVDVAAQGGSSEAFRVYVR